MLVAALVLIGLPLLLLVRGAALVWRATGSRGRPRVPEARRLEIVAGAGVLFCAAFALSGLVVEVQYAVVGFPVLGLLVALAWESLYLGAARRADRGPEA